MYSMVIDVNTTYDKYEIRKQNHYNRSLLSAFTAYDTTTAEANTTYAILGLFINNIAGVLANSDDIDNYSGVKYALLYFLQLILTILTYSATLY